MKIERGNYQVVRFCCTSGNCVDCLACWNKARRKRVIQGDRYSKKTADAIAHNWRAYDATVERMEAVAT